MESPPTLRMYIASIMAVSQVIDSENEKPDVIVEHEPALIPAESIQGAAREAGRLAYLKWPKGEYFGHEAIIIPVTHQFFAQLKPFLDAGLVPNAGVSESSEKFTFVD